ncbi:hypothetical protein ABBQ38_012685 [Trebouxia sp. C0009 RCD-2024]
MTSMPGSRLCVCQRMPAAPSGCMDIIKAACCFLIFDTLSGPGRFAFTACHSWPHNTSKPTNQEPSKFIVRNGQEVLHCSRGRGSGYARGCCGSASGG